jgi:hypothetical protein
MVEISRRMLGWSALRYVSQPHTNLATFEVISLAERRTYF